jgi:hypothetical protein
MQYTQWRKSSRSGNQANCVAVRTDGHLVQVQDTKDPDGPVLSFPTPIWRAFMSHVAEGALDVK